MSCGECPTDLQRNSNGTRRGDLLVALELFGEVVPLEKLHREEEAAVLQAADEFLGPLKGIHWVRPTGGLYVWLRLPEEIDAGLSGPLFDKAVEQGVLYVPGECCYPGEGLAVRKTTIRLSFGIQCRSTLRRGVESLARAINSVLKE